MVTLKGLVPLLQDCKDLEALSIILNATVVDRNSSKKPGRGVSNRKIWSLHLGDSRIEEPTWVAAFLSSLFPSIDRIDAWTIWCLGTQVERENYGRLWQDTLDLIKAFVAVREQERGWRNNDDRHSVTSSSVSTSEDLD